MCVGCRQRIQLRPVWPTGDQLLDAASLSLVCGCHLLGCHGPYQEWEEIAQWDAVRWSWDAGGCPVGQSCVQIATCLNKLEKLETKQRKSQEGGHRLGLPRTSQLPHCRGQKSTPQPQRSAFPSAVPRRVPPAPFINKVESCTSWQRPTSIITSKSGFRAERS